MSRMRLSVAFLLAALLLAGCATTNAPPRGKPLRVGVKPDYPPIIFDQGGLISGVEADLARMIGARLNRPVRFVHLEWDEQVGALLTGEVDILMSGLTVTEARRARMDFTSPYLQIGQMAIVRRRDLPKYADVQGLRQEGVRVGVQHGTTGDQLVQQKLPKARRVAFLNANDAAQDLIRNRRIDVYVDDAPAIWWLSTQYEADLVMLPFAMSEEYLAWGLRREDAQMRTRINRMLEEWKQDGSLRAVLKRWLPIVQ